MLRKPLSEPIILVPHFSNNMVVHFRRYIYSLMQGTPNAFPAATTDAWPMEASNQNCESVVFYEGHGSDITYGVGSGIVIWCCNTPLVMTPEMISWKDNIKIECRPRKMCAANFFQNIYFCFCELGLGWNSRALEHFNGYNHMSF
ncbi:hypothetical protein POM88_000982 [Heracleum sosnowskyi]|uniref:Uncharacterized protein n=1 Tax=Heracleum sosnowskyi TaxID=360622 RepID=A0AAD8JBN6_9APIA|nr:hypothetical protein POM88_000982 [Heracleum sosnowskyi]